MESYQRLMFLDANILQIDIDIPTQSVTRSSPSALKPYICYRAEKKTVKVLSQYKDTLSGDFYYKGKVVVRQSYLHTGKTASSIKCQDYVYVKQ